LCLGGASGGLANPADDLPDIGSPAQATLTLQDEYQIGRMIVRGLRDQDQILDDPEVAEYIASLGHRLSSHAHDGSQRFNFFVVKDTAVNAFALPGGFIGVNIGLLLETKNESELAGVLAHAISKLTPLPIALCLDCRSRTWLESDYASIH